MKFNFYKVIVFVLIFYIFGCKKSEENNTTNITSSEKIIRYAKGFSVENFNGYSVLKVTNPWPKSTKNYTYILKEKNGVVPDSLKQFFSKLSSVGLLLSMP